MRSGGGKGGRVLTIRGGGVKGGEASPAASSIWSLTRPGTPEDASSVAGETLGTAPAPWREVSEVVCPAVQPVRLFHFWKSNVKQRPLVPLLGKFAP